MDVCFGHVQATNEGAHNTADRADDRNEDLWQSLPIRQEASPPCSCRLPLIVRPPPLVQAARTGPGSVQTKGLAKRDAHCHANRLQRSAAEIGQPAAFPGRN